MVSERPLLVSRLLLTMLGTRMFLYHGDRIPQDGPILVVSNHRSFMDAPLLMAAMGRSVRFACHHYMSQVPVMRELVQQLGCLPLDAVERRQKRFFQQATWLLQAGQGIGIFPEGAPSMIQVNPPQEVGEFQRGFAHLALRAPVENLAVLPVAIASDQETCRSALPLQVLSLFDPSEPLFRQPGWHPMVTYERVNLLVGRPQWISPAEREAYQGREAKTLASELTHRCHGEIQALLQQG